MSICSLTPQDHGGYTKFIAVVRNSKREMLATSMVKMSGSEAKANTNTINIVFCEQIRHFSEYIRHFTIKRVLPRKFVKFQCEHSLSFITDCGNHPYHASQAKPGELCARRHHSDKKYMMNSVENMLLNIGCFLIVLYK